MTNKIDILLREFDRIDESITGPERITMAGNACEISYEDADAMLNDHFDRVLGHA